MERVTGESNMAWDNATINQPKIKLLQKPYMRLLTMGPQLLTVHQSLLFGWAGNWTEHGTEASDLIYKRTTRPNYSDTVIRYLMVTTENLTCMQEKPRKELQEMTKYIIDSFCILHGNDQMNWLTVTWLTG